MPTFDANGNPVYADWSQEALDALYQQFQMMDTAREGLSRPKLRVFYEQLGWNDIQKGIDALVAAGKLESFTGTLPTGRPVELFRWKGV